MTEQTRCVQTHTHAFGCHAVLCDIITVLFNKSFMEEMFRPQDVYPIETIKAIMDKLANSSVMRLQQSSLDKVQPQSRYLLCEHSSRTFLVVVTRADDHDVQVPNHTDCLPWPAAHGDLQPPRLHASMRMKL